MFPNLSSNNRVDGGWRNPELLAEGRRPVLTPNVKGTNRKHGGLIKNSHWVRFAAAIVTRILAIAHVIGRGSEVKVRRFAAQRIVAPVAYLKAVGNWAIRFDPANLMGRTNPCPTVTIRVGGASPQPAVIGFVNARPEAGDCTGSILRVVTTHGTKQAPVTCPSVINNSACSTSAWYFGNSQGVNLRHRFANWLGSFTAPTVCGPLVF